MKSVFFSSADVINPKMDLSKYIAIGKYAFYDVGVLPVIPHFYSLFLNYEKDEDKTIGTLASNDMVFHSSEVWVLGDNITENMENEIAIAKIFKLPIRYISDAEIRRILRKYGGTKIYVEEI